MMIENIQKGQENADITIKSKQAALILEDYKYLLIANDEKRKEIAAGANYDTPEDIANLLMAFATKHPDVMEAILIVCKLVAKAAKGVLNNETSASSKP